VCLRVCESFSIKAQETRAGKTFFKLLALHTNQPRKNKKKNKTASKSNKEKPIHNNLLNFIRASALG